MNRMEYLASVLLEVTRSTASTPFRIENETSDLFLDATHCDGLCDDALFDTMCVECDPLASIVTKRVAPGGVLEHIDPGTRRGRPASRIFGPYMTSLIQRSPALSCSNRRRSLLVGSPSFFRE